MEQNGTFQNGLCIHPNKFKDQHRTAEGKKRAKVSFNGLETLWFNTGSLCNITCSGCYMESSPRNDFLSYLSLNEVNYFIEEALKNKFPLKQVAFTGGEPFMNPQILEIIEAALKKQLPTLILSNGMKPFLNRRHNLLMLKKKYEGKLSIRISIDHYNQLKHQKIRGNRSWDPMMKGLRWLAKHGFTISVAARNCWDETELQTREGYHKLFKKENIVVDSFDPSQLVLFPEMNKTLDVPEITSDCFDILQKRPEDLMCASSRMIIKRKGAAKPVVVPCTLLPFSRTFEMGSTLSSATKSVYLNHPHCAKFCVLGGGSCTTN